MSKQSPLTFSKLCFEINILPALGEDGEASSSEALLHHGLGGLSHGMGLHEHESRVLGGLKGSHIRRLFSGRGTFSFFDFQRWDCNFISLHKKVSAKSFTMAAFESTKNSAFVFVKPHAVTEATKAMVKEGLTAAGLTILSEGR